MTPEGEKILGAIMKAIDEAAASLPALPPGYYYLPELNRVYKDGDHYVAVINFIPTPQLYSL